MNAEDYTPTTGGVRKIRLDHLISVYRVGSGDWSWAQEYVNLIDQPDTQKLLARIRDEGIREPVLLGSDGRVWDGHHRIAIAMHLGLDSVPVEFAGDGGALNALIAEKRAEWEAEQGTAEPYWEYARMNRFGNVMIWRTPRCARSDL